MLQILESKKEILSLNRNTAKHIIGIVVFILYEVGLLALAKQQFNALVLIVFYAINILWFYWLALYALPVLDKRKMYIIAKIALAILGAICFSFLLMLVGRILNTLYLHKVNLRITYFEFFRNFWRSIYISTLALCFWYARHSIVKEKEARLQTQLRLEVEKREMQMENAYLRSQINPHLLFNSLTYLYKELLLKSPDVSKPVILLAEMMDYAMAERANGRASLKEELQHINRLVTFHQLLRRKSLYIQVVHQVENEQAEIPCLLLNHFIENVLKHGVLDDPHHPALIKLREANGVLFFYTRNKVAGGAAAGHQQGLANVKTRLQRHYPGRHELKYYQEHHEFIVELTITL